jgi:hypothetical protein
MTNEEFDILKQELIWEGSKVAVLDSSEQARRMTLAPSMPQPRLTRLALRSVSWRLRWRSRPASPS